jgi:hypothetical protein
MVVPRETQDLKAKSRIGIPRRAAYRPCSLVVWYDWTRRLPKIHHSSSPGFSLLKRLLMFELENLVYVKVETYHSKEPDG